ncbi:MAG: flagellar hook basal-body protein [Candidatus Margulisbacteria bacterium]|nr:flagellar hook basal-body protein [Candidatus Margulisiibacteriota bacterium]
MLDILNNEANAMKAYESALRMSAANLGNSTTVGYKALRYSFQSIFNKVVNMGSAASSTYGGTNPVQEGSSVALSSTKIDFTQGEIGSGGTMDVAINGSGFFIISEDEGRNFIYTRNGQFKFNNSGYLVDAGGRKVYGFKVDPSGNTDQSRLEPIKTDNLSKAGWQYQGVRGILVDDYFSNKNSEGQLSDSKPTFQLALTDFPNPEALLLANANGYRETPASGRPLNPTVSGEEGRGQILSGAVEKSNVSIIGETVDEAEIQRAMNASLTAMKMVNQQIQNVIQTIGS